jgi:hypothetical protein
MRKTLVLLGLALFAPALLAMPDAVTARVGVAQYDTRFDAAALGGNDADTAPGILLRGAVGWRLPADLSLELELVHNLVDGGIQIDTEGFAYDLRQQGLWFGWRSRTSVPFGVRIGSVRNQMTLSVASQQVTLSDTAPGIGFILGIADTWDVELTLQDYNDEGLGEALKNTFALGVSRRFD